MVVVSKPPEGPAPGTNIGSPATAVAAEKIGNGTVSVVLPEAIVTYVEASTAKLTGCVVPAGI
jgi:hypothetical protein